MGVEPLPKIEPLCLDLARLPEIGDFLKSNEYKRYCVQVGLEDLWHNAIGFAQKKRGYYSTILDHELADVEDAMIVVLNYLYKDNRSFFYKYIISLIYSCSKMGKVNLDVGDIIQDLRVISAPEKVIENVQEIANKSIINDGVPISELPREIWNSEKLNACLKQMDSSIERHEYNMTLTYAYSCLEGLFKAFINEKIPDKASEDKLNKMSGIVRDYLKEYFRSGDTEYPELVINLISTITNALSNARNGFSDSHFDREAEQWLAEFSRDCVHAIGRLLLKFIK
ncbi:hypothetical protein [Arcticibacterium luteifluviistationis]|uniref:Abortive infection protein-like C-terminal domain-containing protein n=1 Tax=Arcticibacterium luteifluviistationis TaxID=1784714 RepID=A0A2Z4GDP9_9BACT|nr:hypothetical protein [Arcticibacterium luteifluviistationis]AWV99145.1 hypothetical protein DJ013_13595 [Arcticibacterium luteifluviistationis]